jgi:hypothetical protein
MEFNNSQTQEEIIDALERWNDPTNDGEVN